MQISHLLRSEVKLFDELTTNNACPTRATRSNLATELSDPQCVGHWATVEVAVKTLSFKTILLEPAVTINRETVPWYIERLMAAHTVTKSSEDMDGTVIKSDSDPAGYELLTPSKPIVKPQCNMRSEIEQAMANLGVLTKPDVKAIVPKSPNQID